MKIRNFTSDAVPSRQTAQFVWLVGPPSEAIEGMLWVGECWWVNSMVLNRERQGGSPRSSRKASLYTMNAGNTGNRESVNTVTTVVNVVNYRNLLD